MSPQIGVLSHHQPEDVLMHVQRSPLVPLPAMFFGRTSPDQEQWDLALEVMKQVKQVRETRATSHSNGFLLRLEWTRTEDRGFVFEIRRILNPWFDRFEGQVIPVNEEADPKKTIQILANMVAEFEPAGKPIVLLFARSSISLAGACVWVQS